MKCLCKGKITIHPAIPPPYKSEAPLTNINHLTGSFNCGVPGHINVKGYPFRLIRKSLKCPTLQYWLVYGRWFNTLRIIDED